jgi:hypothetical protein
VPTKLEMIPEASLRFEETLTKPKASRSKEISSPNASDERGKKKEKYRKVIKSTIKRAST